MDHPLALWITGLPGSGKSVVSDELKKARPEFVLIRMDELRRIVTPNPTYSDSERDIVYRCLVYAAKTLTDSGHSVIIDATGNLRKWRDLARKTIPSYGEIYLKCPIKVCRDREEGRTKTHGAPKDIYKKAESGWPVPGVSAPYEEPLNAELVIDTEKTSVPEAVKMIEGVIERLQR